jgi:hypothetical protein
MTIAIVSAGRIRVARNSIQLPNLQVKDILTGATKNAHYGINHYSKMLYGYTDYSSPSVIQSCVNILIQVAGPMLPKAGPGSKISKKMPGSPPWRLAKTTRNFVV